MGACPECEGFGNVIDIDLDLIVPDPRKSLREGAIAPWTTPAYTHELEELIALAGDYDIPLDVPFKNLTEPQLQLIREGVPDRKFGGLRGFFAWLERKKYKMHIRVFLSAGEVTVCARRVAAPDCGPRRWRRRSAGCNIAQVSALKIREAIDFVRNLPLADWQRAVGRINVGASAIAARFSRRGGIKLFNPRPLAAHLKRRRGTTGFAHQRPGLQPGKYAVRAR